MKRLFAGLIFVFLAGQVICQDINTLIKLNSACVQLGSSRKLPPDSLHLQMNLYKINMKMAQHIELLLKAAEYYLLKDYKQSDYYIKQVQMNLRNIEYNNLKLLLITCNYAHAGDIAETSRHYYIIKKINLMEPGNMELIHREIAANLDRKAFDDALARYFYYHRRLNILDTIYNTKAPGIQPLPSVTSLAF
jgi:hypothetical protein